VEVTVRLFAMLRERAGAGELVLDLDDGARVADALAALGDLAEGLPLVMAVNRAYAAEDQTLSPGDELALIPPVSGGERDAPAVHAVVREEPLSLDGVSARVRDPRAGAVVTFQGVTRDVERLEYEAYAEMAEDVMAQLARDLEARYELCAIAIHHRVGTLGIGEASVAIAVSAPHRQDALAACKEAIDRLKETVPLWKKEVYEGGEEWLGRGS
jgi:molybdopterin synthase catalytic subunit/molybdopterin converting factor small subunit